MAAEAALDSHYVTAILVVHDGAIWLPQVLAALASQTRLINRVIAVDTGSIDDSVKLLKSARISIIETERNCGFGEAVKLALDKFPAQSGLASEWIWLIHDDCAPAPTALSELLIAIEDRPQVALAGPKLLGWHDRTHLLEIGISIAGNGMRWTGLEPFEYDQGQRDGIHDVLSVSTAGALIRREVFVELDGFDSNLALFRDDVDFGWRARTAGHSVIAVSKAVAFHAEAAASERRSVDVDGAFLHRPLLLDRRNAAYVLLANSSWWMLPWIAIQLLTSALGRSLGYLIAKLPGYASDEILAVLALIANPNQLIKARRWRKKKRLVSPRVVAAYIPPRWSQLRLALSRTGESIRERLLPTNFDQSTSARIATDDEDLLVPIQSARWTSLLRKPMSVGLLGLSILTLIWSRNRFGSISGGALPISQTGASDLWQSYFASWHQVGMGSANAAPPWLAVLAAASIIFLGKVPFMMTLIFILLPVILFWSSHFLFAKLSKSASLAVAASVLYAISPVSIAAINSGRIGTLTALIFAPLIPLALRQWREIELLNWRRIFGASLLFSLIFSFTLVAFLILFAFSATAIVSDYLKLRGGLDPERFKAKLFRRITLLIAPLLVTLPYSFEALLNPSRLLSEPGFALAGGGPNLAALGNPGGPGSPPWWLISPILIMLIIALFSSSSARSVAEIGFGFLVAATLISALAISTHGNYANTPVWTGTLLVGATLAALVSAVMILDRLREHLVRTNFHYRHILAGLLLITTTLYTVASVAWIATSGANSPVHTNLGSVMPSFLAVEKNTKTLVISEEKSAGSAALQYFISRGSDIQLGDPDVAPVESEAMEVAVRDLVAGSGILSSKTFANYGIKYIFIAQPSDKEIVRTIDGIGGFNRASATSAGIVWRVTGVTGRLIFTDAQGARSAIETGEVGARTMVTAAGTLTLTENYSRSWQIIENGKRLPRVKNDDGLTQFSVFESGEFSLIHDGTIRRGWLSLQFIAIVVVVIFALPSGRRKREISEKELA